VRVKITNPDAVSFNSFGVRQTSAINSWQRDSHDLGEVHLEVGGRSFTDAPPM
jgi:hypothetical protein